MKPAQIVSALLLWTVLWPGVLSGQARKLTPKQLPPSAFKLIAVKVTGTQRYQQPDILAASGLQIGETVSEDDFKRTARLLGETGAFSNVLYSYQYAPEGTKLELQLTDADQFVPTRFDNFAWFSDQELMEKVRERVPLFTGQLPAAGGLADLISDALQALLIQAGVPGRADYLRSAKPDGPIDAVVFSITGINLQVRNISFSGAGDVELPLLTAASKAMRGQEYRRSLVRAQADKNFLPVYFSKGYLKASIADPEAKVASHEDQQVLVDVNFPVNPGRQYKVSHLAWSGNTVFPAEKLQPLIHLTEDQPADAIKLSSDLEEVRRLYGTRGYMAEAVKPVPEFDEAQGKVSYQLQVSEGDPYHMGDLEITGIDTRTIDKLVDRWQLHGGDAYDASYARRFLSQITKEILYMAQWKVSIHESVNQKDMTVDVSLRFDPVS